MKRCSYCGAEYSDEATECAIDKTPFVDLEPKPVHLKYPTFAIFSERKIPVSLAIVSYLFFFPGAICFAFVIFILAVLILSGGQAASGWVILGCIAGGAGGIFWLLLSRGLRRCSRGWRICALVFIWWGFIGIAFSIVRFLLTGKTTEHEATTLFWLNYGVWFVVQVWQYRVLTRPDVRDLFGA